MNEIAVACPRYPDHGVVRIRWLPLAERELITKRDIADVYEVECRLCGKYEWNGEHPIRK